MNIITIPWSDWTIVREIGRGGFGTVYKIRRRGQFGSVEYSALKVVSVPYNRDEINTLRMEGYDDASIAARYKEYANRINKEYHLQKELKETRNIVSVEENIIIPHEDGLGQDIFIRMELLHTMQEILEKKKTISEFEVIRLGEEICEALNVCHGRRIIHRDIKPENIFQSDAGDWKLGDFGIARTMEHTTTATKAGTYGFMAPEVYHGEKYGKEVDIYSLGMVLYWLLNNRRKPFLPTDRIPKASEEEEARVKRFSGKYPIPAPLNGSEGLKQIVLKACSYDPKDRYTSAEEMRRDLEELFASGSYRISFLSEAARGKNNSSFVLGSTYGQSDGSADYENDSDTTVGSMFATGEGVTQGNGWQSDGDVTIGNPRRSMGDKDKKDYSEKSEKTERSVNVGDIVKKDEERIDTPGSKTRSEKPCPVRRLLVGEAILIGGIVWMLFGYPPFGYWYYTILLDIHHLRESGHFLYFYFDALIEFLVDIISRLLLMGGGPILTIVFWKADRKIFDICKSLIYLNIVVCFSQHLAVLVLEFYLYRVGMGEIYMFIGFGMFLSILIAFYGGRWMLSEKLTGKKDKTK